MSKNDIYIYPLPPESAEHNCSGTVVGMQYCYRNRSRRMSYGRNQTLFQLLFLTRNGYHNVYTVDSSVTVSATPQEATCTDEHLYYRVCCENTTVGANNLQITEAFGIVQVSNGLHLLSFRDSQYRVDVFETKHSGQHVAVGSNFTLSHRQNRRRLFLLRLFLGTCIRVMHGPL